MVGGSVFYTARIHDVNNTTQIMNGDYGCQSTDTTLLVVFDYYYPSLSYPEISITLVFITVFKGRFHA